MANAKKHLNEDTKLNDTYEIARSTNMISLLTQIIDNYTDSDIQKTFEVSYDNIISYLEYVIEYAGNHSTMISVYLHCVDEMKNTEKIDIILNTLRKNDYNMYIDTLYAVCINKTETNNELFEYFYDILKNEYALMGKEISTGEFTTSSDS